MPHLTTVQFQYESKIEFLGQNYVEDLRSLTSKTKIWQNNSVSRGFGRYPFVDVSIFKSNLTLIWFLILDVVVDGARQLKEECKLALEEVKYYAKSEHFKKCFIKPGDVQYLCNFAESPTNTTAINDLFTISSDSTWGEGYSMGSLEASSALNSGLYDIDN